jgi:hypothetical protein
MVIDFNVECITISLQELPEFPELTGEFMQRLKGTPKIAHTDELTPIEDFAVRWEVDPKTVGQWVEVVFLAFDVILPKSGPFPEWGVKLLDITAKHISKKATLYFADTQEQRRLKGTEFIRKIQHMTKEGHFQEFQKFRKSAPQQDVDPDEDEDLEILAELAQVSRSNEQELDRIFATIETREDEQIERIATFIEGQDARKMTKLARRLKTRALPDLTTGQTINASFQRLT